MFFHDLPESEVQKLLPYIDSYNENPYYSRSNFEKNFDIGCKYFGCFSGGKCLALLSVSEDTPSLSGLTYFRELAGFFPGHGHGMDLLKYAMKKYENMWLISNPVSGEKLAKNYRNIPDLKEYVIPKSNFENIDMHFFYKIVDNKKETQLIEFLNTVWKNKND